MFTIDEIIRAVSVIEESTFSDFWSAQSISESLSHDYNKLLVACAAIKSGSEETQKKSADNIVYYNIEGGANPKLSCLNDLPRKKDSGLKKTSLGDESVAGYVMYSIVADESELYRIAVCEDYRKKGIGSMLMQRYILEISKKATKSFLEVRAGNEAAIKLYEMFDFEKIAERKKYYSNPSEDAYIYSLGLP